MQYPNFQEEKKLWKQGFECVVGLDEVGRGPLAGPVVAGAVVIAGSDLAMQLLGLTPQLKGIKDSKKLSGKQREEFYEILTNHSAISWGIGIVSEKVIDKINILEATKLAMEKAIDSLNLQYSGLPHGGSKATARNDGRRVDFLLIDGNFAIDTAKFRGRPTSPEIGQKSIIKGDQKVFSIAAASIIAKVTRDRIMRQMDKKYPGYGFGKHKGYGTAAHLANLRNFGPCKIHRRSFYPISSYV